MLTKTDSVKTYLTERKFSFHDGFYILITDVAKELGYIYVLKYTFYVPLSFGPEHCFLSIEKEMISRVEKTLKDYWNIEKCVWLKSKPPARDG